LAEFERELIRARTGEGRERAKDRGVRFGRPRKLTAHQRREALARLAAGETQADVGRSYNVDATTIGDFSRLMVQQTASNCSQADGEIAHVFGFARPVSTTPMRHSGPPEIDRTVLHRRLSSSIHKRFLKQERRRNRTAVDAYRQAGVYR
jgi:hypothetical protein